MKTILNAALITLSLTGCIIYDEELTYEEGVERGSDRPNSSSGDLTTQTKVALSLSPSQGSAGELALVSLLSEGADLGEVVDLTFYGDSDLLVVAEQLREETEIILALDIPNKALLGANHLLVEFGDGSEIFLSDAFEIVD
jgi:hypothetical protein